MVKGVNKRIIEINNTNNEMFDRVLLFVNSNYCDDEATIQKEANKISSVLLNQGRIPLRTMAKKRKSRIITVLAIAAAFIIVGALWLFIK